MNKVQLFYTVKDVARITTCSVSTVFKWIHKDMLSVTKLPFSKRYLVPRSHLINFLKEYKVPLPKELQS